MLSRQVTRMLEGTICPVSLKWLGCFALICVAECLLVLLLRHLRLHAYLFQQMLHSFKHASKLKAYWQGMLCCFTWG